MGNSSHGGMCGPATQVTFQTATQKIVRATAPAQLIFISDPGQDLDDEMTFIMMKHLVELKVAEVKGIVTTLTPAFDRARLTRGTLDILGLFGVPIGVGSDGGDLDATHSGALFEGTAAAYMPTRYSAAADALLPGDIMLHNIYADADPRSLTLVILASMKDAALYLRDEPELFKEKTREVVIMGGVVPIDKEKVSNGKPTILEPDTANNNTFDMAAAKFLYRRVQELAIPLIIVTRWAAYAAKLPTSCYNDLAASGSWIGCRLKNAQRASIESLWSRAASPAGSEERAGLPERCNRDWFLKTFCAGADASNRSPTDTIWDLIAGFVQYDAVATLAAIPPLRDELFSPAKVTGEHGVVHMVIGATEHDHHIRSTPQLSRFLASAFTKGLSYNHHRKKQIIILLQPRWSSHADNLTAFVILRALFALGVFDCAGIILQSLPSGGKNGQANEDIDVYGKETQDALYALGLAHVPVLVCDANGKNSTRVGNLKTLYDSVAPAGVSLVVCGCLDLAADFVLEHSSLFVEKTQNVILVGGAIVSPEVDENGRPTGEQFLEPDPGAHQYLFDMDASKRFFKAAQMLLVPLCAVSRHFVEAVQIPRGFFDILGDQRYGGIIGKQVLDKQKAGVSQLWAAVRADIADRVGRRSLPDRCDRQWFVDTFCSGSPPASDKDEDVWKAMQDLSCYNAQAMMLALPPIFNRFSSGTTVIVRSVRHKIIGKSGDDPGILDRSEFRKLILQCIVNGTRCNSSIFDLQEPPPIYLDESQRSSEWRYEKRKDALNWLLPVEYRRDLLDSTDYVEDLWLFDQA